MKIAKRVNGTGSVYRLSDRNRRCPWVAVITLSYDTKKRRKLLGTFATQDEAMLTLLTYNSQFPAKSTASGSTFSDLYLQWSQKHFPEVTESTQKVYQAAFRNSSPLHERIFSTLMLDDLENCIRQASVNYQSARTMKNLFGQLYKYAIPRKHAEVNYAQYLCLRQLRREWDSQKKERSIFTPEEISRLLSDARANDFCKTVCMLIYSGLRISELLNLKKEDCDPANRCITIRKSKTAAGLRSVPLSAKTLAYWHYFYELASDGPYLITLNGCDLAGRRGYDLYYGRQNSYWKTYFADWKQAHTVHETRHTCETMLRQAEIYPAKINAIIGHSGNSIGEKTYTHLTIDDLLPEIDKI
ncbi:MAG: tyrosine-type recombinase/integrase [Lachnospiraceae bacterium]|nr:tyrosine-type recombinase/integrase [Lachnospiraceae bacterium]